jgi:hypothetical protein
MGVYLHYINKIKQERKIHAGKDSSAFHSPDKKWQCQGKPLCLSHCPLWSSIAYKTHCCKADFTILPLLHSLHSVVNYFYLYFIIYHT